MALWEGKIPKWIAWVFIFLVFLFVVYHYYYIYKVFTAKCQVCGEKIRRQWGRKIVYIYTPWRKIRFTCENCQEKKKISVWFFVLPNNWDCSDLNYSLKLFLR